MPLSVRVENPVSLPVGYDPILPLIVVAPVLVIPVPANTAKEPALPRETNSGEASAVPENANNVAIEVKAAIAVATPALKRELLLNGTCFDLFIFPPALSCLGKEEDDGLVCSEKIDFPKPTKYKELI